MSKKPLILIVDDLDSNIQFLAMTLKNIDCRITATNSGEKAIKIAQKQIPNLILLDVMMPEMDGFEVCKILKNNPTTKKIPIIFITAKTDKESIIKGLKAGAIDYITKPFIAEELLARIKNLLKSLDTHRELTELRIKNTVLAMTVTANHEIRQPLTIIQMQLDMIKLENKNMHTKLENRFNKIEQSLGKIKIILEEHQNFNDITEDEYIPGTKMLNLVQNNKD